MKKYLYILFYHTYLFFFRYWVFVSSKLGRSKSFLIVDIDNTICDTWPLLMFESDLAKVYSRADCFTGVRNHVIKLSESSDVILVFLTARNLKYFFLTKKWLKKYQFKGHLFMCNSIDFKFIFLKILVSSQKCLILDDFSWNHENGNVIFYDYIVDYLTNHNNSEYFDYLALKKLQLSL
jgi:hypothetical protein